MASKFDFSLQHSSKLQTFAHRPKDDLLHLQMSSLQNIISFCPRSICLFLCFPAKELESKEPQGASDQSTLLEPETFHRSDLSVNWFKVSSLGWDRMMALSVGAHI